MKKTLLLFVCLVLSTSLTYAQTRITGTVTEQDGATPMPYVTVSVKGLAASATTTDANGKYSINVPANATTLIFSFVGMGTEEVNIGRRNIIDVMLAPDGEALDEAVITAEFGLKRPARATGAAVQAVKGAEIAQSGRENFVNALQGRVAGLQVNSTTGTPGASSTITIRGATSISGNNQPLFVIDGIPMNNSTFDPTTGMARNSPTSDPAVTSRSLDFSNRASDLNPEDIESMTILKGAAAAVLYGSDASNGAIIITTKKGTSGRARVSYNNSFRFDKAYRYPEVQKKYDNGGHGTTNYYNQNHFGQEYLPGTPLYDNIGNLFETGFSHRHNVSLESGNEKMTVRAAAGYVNTSGVVPTSKYERMNFSLSGTAKLNSWLSMEGSFQYANTFNKKVAKGDGGILQRTLIWPLTDDMRSYLKEDGALRRPNSYADWDILNPYFALHKNKNEDETDRFITNLAVTITPIKDLFIRTQVGIDVSTTTSEVVIHPQWSSTNLGTGSYDMMKYNTNDPTINVIAGYRKELGRFNLSAQVGYHQQEQKFHSLAVHGEKFKDPEFYSIMNCDQTTLRNLTRTTKRRLQAISATVEISYKNLVFLSVKGRSDWSSTLPKDNNSFVYPGADLSIILSDLPFMKPISKTVNYLKLRGSAAQVGKDAPPLSIYPMLEAVATMEGGYRYGYTGPNPDLKPEMNTAWEVGLEARMFNNRMDLDFAVYGVRSKDQIITGFRMSHGTGFILNNMNVGTISTNGVEGRISGDIIKTADWTVNLGLNFSHNWSKVLKLPPNVSEYYDAYTWVAGNIRNGIQVGQPITSISGLDYQRNSQGQVLIDPSTGLPLTESTWTVLGDREPDLDYGITADIRWKSWSFSALLTGRIGATVVNGTKRYMMQRGLSDESVKFRERGILVFNGVLKDGSQNSSTPTTNTIGVNLASLSGGYLAGDPNWVENNVNYLRLAELRLSYTIPSGWLMSKTGKLISSARIFVAANDLFVFTNYSGIDVVGNSNSAALGGTGGVGFDMLGIAAPRGFSFGLSLSF